MDFTVQKKKKKKIMQPMQRQQQQLYARHEKWQVVCTEGTVECQTCGLDSLKLGLNQMVQQDSDPKVLLQSN